MSTGNGNKGFSFKRYKGIGDSEGVGGISGNGIQGGRADGGLKEPDGWFDGDSSLEGLYGVEYGEFMGGRWDSVFHLSVEGQVIVEDNT